jgi:hexosaminidase
MRWALLLLFVSVFAVGILPSRADEPLTDLHLLPRPASIRVLPQCSGFSLTHGLRVPPNFDAGARALLDERFRALGIPALRTFMGDADVRVRLETGGVRQSYRLVIDRSGVDVRAGDADGAFYALVTLAQLAYVAGTGPILPCVDIADAPALSWRVLSDDVSRGPLPTMRYFQERIRTIAAFKMNGYSPYMEHVFVDPHDPLTAPLDGITPGELRELDAYARRFHVALIPEQQTFAHMHNTLRWERYAPLAELPHGYLLSPADEQGERYVREVIGDELAMVDQPPFFHIGADEPLDLGRGRSEALVAREGEGPVYTRHVVETARFIAERGIRPLIWDDALSRHPELFAQLPKSLVFVSWHYKPEKTYASYIKRIADAGFEQMLAPAAANTDELYPDIDTALANIDGFVSDGKNAHVLGLFQTVWHDDGETLFEATWYPVLYAAASAWEEKSVDRTRFTADFPWAFFGTGDEGYAADVEALARARTLLHAGSNRFFWADLFNPTVFAEAPNADAVSAMRLQAERAIEHLRLASPPPLHANAAEVMHLAARRYDALGRNIQIASEARAYYEDARANMGGAHDDIVYRDLFVTKYLFWEQRDTFLELESLMRAAWEYENRSSHELSVLERYHLAAQHAITRADAIDGVTHEGYQREKKLPPFPEVVR